MIVIVGATGTGKSLLSLELAERSAAAGVPAEIINADAMQLYRGMDIGTAKLPESERRGIPHHMLDVLDPSDEASVAHYQTETRAVVEGIEARGALPILVGGSGLYVSSVIQDFRFPGTDAAIRERWEAELESSGPGMLHRTLLERDPEAAHAIGPHNGRRLVRALEVIDITGEPFGAGLPEDAEPWRDAHILALGMSREALVPRLDDRVRGMWADGILDEVRGLDPESWGVTARRAIGYAQARDQLEGVLTELEAIESTAALTRRYARRQVSWFRRYRGAHWLDAEDPLRTESAAAVAIGKD